MASKQRGTKKLCSSSVAVLSTLQDFRRTKKFCDITLKCGERSYYAHCCVLAAVSPYFLAMFRSQMSEVYSQTKTVDLAFLSVSSANVRLILDYMYGEVVEIDLENAFEVLAIADYMLLKQLKTEICAYLAENLSIDKPEVCFATRRAAEMYGCKKLYENTDCFIKAMFYRLSQTAAFCALSDEELKSILECDNLSASEPEVFESILKWVSHSREERDLSFLNLLDCVRPNAIYPKHCIAILEHYKFKYVCLLDLFPEGFLKSEYDDPLDMASIARSHNMGRQGQEVILVFDNEKSQAYLPGLDHWHPIAPVAELIRDFKTVYLNGFIYLLGGTVEQKLSLSVWRYDTNYNTWKRRASMLKTAASFGLAAISSLPDNLSGCLYASGGPNPKYNMQKYDVLEDSWSFESPMQVTRVHHCMVTFEDRYVVAIGGNTPSTDSLYTVEKYDTHTGIWSYMPSLNIGRIESSAVVFEDKIYVVGGYSGSSPAELHSCEVYCNDQWTLIEPTIVPRREAGITVYHGKVYILGGTSKKQASCFEYYCEDTKSWKSECSSGYSAMSCQCLTVPLSGKQICNLYES